MSDREHTLSAAQSTAGVGVAIQDARGFSNTGLAVGGVTAPSRGTLCGLTTTATAFVIDNTLLAGSRGKAQRIEFHEVGGGALRFSRVSAADTGNNKPYG